MSSDTNIKLTEHDMLDEVEGSDLIAYFEMAKIAMESNENMVKNELCLSDDEFHRLQEQLNEYMDNA